MLPCCGAAHAKVCTLSASLCPAGQDVLAELALHAAAVWVELVGAAAACCARDHGLLWLSCVGTGGQPCQASWGSPRCLGLAEGALSLSHMSQFDLGHRS